ncbi:MAG: glutamate racemase [Buchnera aphidicola (Floraphis choui)]
MKNSKTDLKQNTICNILIFDSGLGGLSIYKKIKNYFPYANYIYAFDNEKFPYGNKKESFIITRCLKIIYSISNIINITIAIVACNTASITSLPTLQHYFNFPIIGIIPNIKKAVKITKNNIIGLLATKTTINNYNIQRTISSLSPNFIIKTLHNENLVKIAEKKLKYNFTELKLINNILKPWYLTKNKPDTIILGCTHFYFLKNEIRHLFSKNINIIDSNINISKKIWSILKNNIVRNENIAFFSKSIKNDISLLSLFNKYKFLKFSKLNLKLNIFFNS